MVVGNPVTNHQDGEKGSKIHGLSALQFLSNLATGTELRSIVSKIPLKGNELNELKFKQFQELRN